MDGEILMPIGAVCAEEDCTVEYSFTCQACGAKRGSKWKVHRGDEYPVPGIPPDWSPVVTPDGRHFLLCGKHKVQIRVDGKAMD
jgi:hypothetical protein